MTHAEKIKHLQEAIELHFCDPDSPTAKPGDVCDLTALADGRLAALLTAAEKMLNGEGARADHYSECFTEEVSLLCVCGLDDARAALSAILEGK